MSVLITKGQKVQLKAKPVGADGELASVENVLWETSGTAGLTLKPSDTDPLVCEVTGLSAGDAEISLTVDADLSAGVRNLVAGLSLRVLDPEAVELSIEVINVPSPMPVPPLPSNSGSHNKNDGSNKVHPNTDADTGIHKKGDDRNKAPADLEGNTDEPSEAELEG